MMGNTNKEIAARSDQVFIGTYSRYPAVMVKGAGCRLTDAEGKEYLDFLAGIAVCGLGHCHPAVTAAICHQAGELVHVSNLYYTEPQTELAELLTAHSFADRVFLANSGAEANEAAIKTSVRYAPEVADSGKRNGQQLLQKSPHPVSSKRYPVAYRHSLTQLKCSDGFLCPSYNGPLTSNQRQIAYRILYDFVILATFTQSHIQ